jgi:hypothetical protein
MLALFSIVGGHEIIGKIETEVYDGSYITLEHPLVIRPVQKAPGQYALDLFPHSLTNPEGKHKFYTAQMVSRSVEIPEMLEKAYTERTSSIILASAMDQLERGIK